MSVKPDPEHVERFPLRPFRTAPDRRYGIDAAIFIRDLGTNTKTLIVWMGVEIVDHIETRLARVSMRVILIVNGGEIVQAIVFEVGLMLQEGKDIPDPALLADDGRLAKGDNDIENLAANLSRKIWQKIAMTDTGALPGSASTTGSTA